MKTERFEMRLDSEVLERIDAWRTKRRDEPSRAETIRQLIELGLAEYREPQVRLSDGESLLVAMMRDIYRHLKIKDAEVDPDFVFKAVSGGHLWALNWEYESIFPNHSDRRQTVTEVVDILDMWSFIEEGRRRLPKEVGDQLDEAIEQEYAGSLTFLGFDGNNETTHRSIALFLVNHMGRFATFKGRTLNAHRATLGGYRNMLTTFEPIRRTLDGSGLSADQIASIVRSRNG